MLIVQYTLSFYMFPPPPLPTNIMSIPAYLYNFCTFLFLFQRPFPSSSLGLFPSDPVLLLLERL